MSDLAVNISPTDEELRALEERCASIKDILKDFASPWVVEFAGLPRAGKSGCIESIDHLLRRNGLSVLTPFEGAGRAPEHLKDDLVAYNTWTATYAIQQILEGSVRSSKAPRQRYDIVLLDRGLFDATAWLHLFESRGELDKDHRHTCAEFLRLPKWSSLVRQVFVFSCLPEEALQRELRGKLSDKPGRVVDKSFLQELGTAYENACGCYEEDFDIGRVNTDGVGVREVAFGVATHLIAAIEKARLQHKEE